MGNDIQRLRVMPATEVAKRWNVIDKRLDEIVTDYKISYYSVREKRIRPSDGKTIYFCSGPYRGGFL